MHKIVVNACLDRIRRNRSRPTTPLPDGDSFDLADARDSMADVETSIEVHTALMSLAPDQRAAVVAVDMEGYSVADAARLLGVPAGTVKSRCARGRLKLAIRLQFLREDGNR
jgi:RNA polymerase sigma-70 factor (ECF subfamily)